ncbi:L-2-amino-thiazoline-4-carboxylic acid hydrolase [candidate division KSB1 bacterium]|nr:L-2-amino-thiazoline-4-carboxylic acid hydrolase [candidate division KSB1 bacterium]
MSSKSPSGRCNRRQFLATVMPAAAFTCLGSSVIAQQQHEIGPTDPFEIDAGITYRELAQFSFQVYYIPVMKHLCNHYDKQEFMYMLQQAFNQLYTNTMMSVRESYQTRNLDTFLDAYKVANMMLGQYMKDPRTLKSIMQTASHLEIVEQTESVLELRCTKCLFAEIYREANAANLGFVTHCYGDQVLANTFDPRLNLHRTKTLMQGDECCNPRYIFEDAIIEPEQKRL